MEDLGELKFGADRIDPQERQRRFPTEEEFIRAVKGSGGVTTARTPSFAVTEGKGHVETLRRSFPEARIVWDNRKFYLLVLPQSL